MNPSIHGITLNIFHCISSSRYLANIISSDIFTPLHIIIAFHKIAPSSDAFTCGARAALLQIESPSLKESLPRCALDMLFYCLEVEEFLALFVTFAVLNSNKSLNFMELPKQCVGVFPVPLVVLASGPNREAPEDSVEHSRFCDLVCL